VEYTTIVQAASKTEGANEEPAKQSTLPAADDDVELDNNIDDDNLDTDHDDMEIDDGVGDDNLDADHNDDTPLRFRSINDNLGTARFVPRALVAEELHMVCSDELASFAEAERSSSWRKTMM
jgi:hypothetical protein